MVVCLRRINTKTLGVRSERKTERCSNSVLGSGQGAFSYSNLRQVVFIVDVVELTSAIVY